MKTTKLSLSIPSKKLCQTPDEVFSYLEKALNLPEARQPRVIKHLLERVEMFNKEHGTSLTLNTLLQIRNDTSLVDSREMGVIISKLVSYLIQSIEFKLKTEVVVRLKRTAIVGQGNKAEASIIQIAPEFIKDTEPRIFSETLRNSIGEITHPIANKFMFDK